jgi:hypothetical protein
MSNQSWPEVWQGLQDKLRNQPRCVDHPEYPCVKTLSQRETNDIVEVSPEGIRVKSHRTEREDFISASQFETWWHRLVATGSASLQPGHPNNPDADRSYIVGAILVTCLPKRIQRDESDNSTIKLI